MHLYRLEQSQDLPIDLDTAWQFFSDPQNLERITPPTVSFRITSGAGEPVFAGQLISYQLKLFGFWPQQWLTEITAVQPGRYFIDEQRHGPYRLWHHLHRFRDRPGGGVQLFDRVTYAMPFGPLGRMVHAVRVRSEIEGIFQHRRRILEDLFAEEPAMAVSA